MLSILKQISLFVTLFTFVTSKIIPSIASISNKTMSKLLPTLFLSHGGGPAHLLDFSGSMFSEIDKNSKSAEFFRGLSKIIKNRSDPNPIECILVVSGHWEESTFTVDYQNKGATKLVYDYYGFPEESYSPHLTYPVKTNLSVADKVVNRIQAAGLPCEKANRGFDHGTFIPLKVIYPEAQIPVVQLSLKSNLNLAEHIRLGEILKPLRKEGVLIIGSGQITHNLRELRAPKSPIDKRATAFTDWVKNFLEVEAMSKPYEESKNTLINIASQAPNFYWCHPRTEHFVPLAVIFGAAFGPDSGDETCSNPPKAERLYHEVVVGTMAIDSYIFE